MAFGYLLNRSLNLKFNGELIALLPEDNDHLATYEKLEELNSTEGGFTLVIHSVDDRPVIEPAHAIRDTLLELKQNGQHIFRGAELENDLYDIRKSALFLMTNAELDQLHKEVDEYIREKKLEANPMYVNFDEEDSQSAEIDLGGQSSVLLEEVANTRRYKINEDSTVISMLFLPDFPKSDYSKVEQTYRLLRQKKSEIEAQHEGLELFWGGSYVNHYNKINDVQASVTKALVIGILSLVSFLVAYMIFINRSSAYKARYIIIDLLLMFFVLFSGFVISIGLSSFIFNEINVFTGIIFSILFGINLDYILHLYSINKQHPPNTSSVKKVVLSYFSSTKPILLSCLTTGLAIMSLIFAEFQGFIQFGIIFFINVLVNLFSTYLFLLLSPSLAKNTTKSEKPVEPSPTFLSEIAKPIRTVSLPLFFIVILFGGFIGAKSMSFNFNFSDLEPASRATPYDSLSSETNTSEGYHEPSYFITDNIQESKELFSEIKKGIGGPYNDIERVESFSARYPVDRKELDKKAQKVDSIQQLLNANEEFLKDVNDDAKEFIDIAENTVPPSIDGLPKYIKNRFFYKDGSMAPLVVIYPAMSLSNGQTSIQFRKSSGTIRIDSGKTFYAASTTIIASSILELLIRESTFLFVVPLITIFLILLVYYRSLVKAFMAAAPLLLTIGMLLSIRSVFMFDINLYNVIVFPIIIGVGADNGIHLVDALINKRSNFLEYFISVKFPVLAACSVTTILGFIGLLFIDHPGMESVGILAITGITTTLVATYLIALSVQTYLLRR
ncbi:MMPL family transporter [Gracilimonas tropica]|uniref:MMPL family transporter n=1 Tax=Gracilimonas tropica TaxID=454600 RepID=UPI0003A7081E|nr:MMPL family transporter [Gracilimonas tropica]